MLADVIITKTGVGFCVVRSTPVGNSRASACRTGNKYGSHALCMTAKEEKHWPNPHCKVKKFTSTFFSRLTNGIALSCTLMVCAGGIVACASAAKTMSFKDHSAATSGGNLVDDMTFTQF